MQLGKKKTVQALGRTWTFSRLTVGIILSFRDWIAEQIGDPFQMADRFLDKIADHKDKLALIKEGEDIKRQLRGFSLACPLAQQFLATEVGACAFCRLLLEEHQPGVTEEQAFAVTVAMGEQLGLIRQAISLRLRLALEQQGRGEAVDVDVLSKEVADIASTSVLPQDVLPGLIAELGGVVPNGEPQAGSANPSLAKG